MQNTLGMSIKDKEPFKFNQDADSKRQTNINFRNKEPLNLDLLDSDQPMGNTLNKKPSKKSKFKVNQSSNLDLLTQSQTMFENQKHLREKKLRASPGGTAMSSPKVLKETGMVHGKYIRCLPVEKIADIDTEEDFEFAKRLLKQEKYLPLLNLLNEIKKPTQ